MPGIKHKILFVCIHNSARSQMAEAFLRKYGGERFEVESAGLEPGKLNPIVVESMKEKGIDISNHGTQSVFDLFREGRVYSAVITVCDEASAEACPIFPGSAKRIAWSFADPAVFGGSKEEIVKKTGEVRDEIEKKVFEFIKEAEELAFRV
jgi:arsenate reductase